MSHTKEGGLDIPVVSIGWIEGGESPGTNRGLSRKRLQTILQNLYVRPILRSRCALPPKDTELPVNAATAMAGLRGLPKAAYSAGSNCITVNAPFTLSATNRILSPSFNRSSMAGSRTRKTMVIFGIPRFSRGPGRGVALPQGVLDPL